MDNVVVMETFPAEILALQDLDPWLTPMQAVVWITMRDPLLVRRASLEELESKEAAALIPNDVDCSDPCRAGMSLLSLNLFLALAPKRPVRSAELALRCLLGSLRRGEVNASAEACREQTGLRSDRALMSSMEWAAIILADAPEDDRKLATYIGPELSQFLTGYILDTRWQSVRIKTSELLARFPAVQAKIEPSPPGRAPDGHLFIDDAVVIIMARHSMPEGPALKWLREKLRDADIQSYKRHGPDLIKCDPGVWATADINLMEFRRSGNDGLQLEGRDYHLHRAVLAVPDFEFCLATKVHEPTESDSAVKPQAHVPAELAAWMKQHMHDGLDKHGLLPKRNPSVKQCMDVFECSWREGLAAYRTLPAELRRSARETDRALSVQRAHARTAVKTV